MAKYNDTLTKSYKNADIAIVIEDDLITTAKLYIGNDCKQVCDISTTDNPDGIPFTRANYDAVVESMKADVDKMWEDNLVALGINA